MKYTTLFLLLIFSACGRSQINNQIKPETKQLDLDCDNPDCDKRCMFINMPENTNSVINIINPELNQNLVIKGKIINAKNGKPYPGVYLYAYHTDETGLYSKNGKEEGVQKWHGKHHGWCKTDQNGNYEIHTIRPAPYPTNTMPAHIHAYIRLSGDNIFYINDFVFSDDKLADEKYLSNLKNKNNPADRDNGVVTLLKRDGIFYGERDIYVLE